MGEIEWAVDRAIVLLGDWGQLGVRDHPATQAFARYIAEHEEAPVDKDVLAVREILAGWWRSPITDQLDDDPDFRRALAAYRRHKGKESGE